MSVRQRISLAHTVELSKPLQVSWASPSSHPAAARHPSLPWHPHAKAIFPPLPGTQQSQKEPSVRGSSEGNSGGIQGEFASDLGIPPLPLSAEPHSSLCGSFWKAAPSIPFIILEREHRTSSARRGPFRIRACLRCLQTHYAL